MALRPDHDLEMWKSCFSGATPEFRTANPQMHPDLRRPQRCRSCGKMTMSPIGSMMEQRWGATISWLRRLDLNTNIEISVAVSHLTEDVIIRLRREAR